MLVAVRACVRPHVNVAILGSRGFPSTYGGYETLVRHLARDWVQRGHTVTVYCRSRDQGRRRWMTEGVRCHWTPGRDSKSLSTLTFGATSHLHACVHTFDSALVVNVANGYFLPLLKAGGVPCVVNTDGIEWERGKWGRTARTVFRGGASLCARYANVLIADSQAIAQIWLERFGVQSQYIPYGAPVLEDLGADRVEALGLKTSGYLLVVARLIPENNVDLFLDALATMTNPPPAVVVGSASTDSPLETRLRTLQANGSVMWLGHVADQELLTQLWFNCGVYVHGHSVGGTNPGLLQALGAGAPTLTLDTIFNREVVGRAGRLFPADATALASLMEELFRDTTARRELAQYGRRLIAERYNWDAVSAAYLSALVTARDAARQR